jgi:hypothetical protein
MQIIALILGIIGTLTGTASLIIKIIEFYNDRARLVIQIAFSTESSKKFPINYFSLKIIFINRGRRPITIIDGAIDLPRRDLLYQGKEMEAASAEQSLFKITSHAGITIEPHKRQQLIFEPFDARLLKDCDGHAVAFFTDAIGNRYEVGFAIPPGDHIVQMTAAWVALNKQQESDAINPAKHPQ